MPEPRPCKGMDAFCRAEGVRGKLPRRLRERAQRASEGVRDGIPGCGLQVRLRRGAGASAHLRMVISIFTLERGDEDGVATERERG